MLASTWPWPKSTPATTTVYWICSPKNYAWHTPNYVPSLASSRATICWARFFPASASGSEAESMDIHLSLSMWLYAPQTKGFSSTDRFSGAVKDTQAQGKDLYGHR